MVIKLAADIKVTGTGLITNGYRTGASCVVTEDAGPSRTEAILTNDSTA